MKPCLACTQPIEINQHICSHCGMNQADFKQCQFEISQQQIKNDSLIKSELQREEQINNSLFSQLIGALLINPEFLVALLIVLILGCILLAFYLAQ